MKNLYLIALPLLLPFGILAQQISPNSSELSILKKKWEMKSRNNVSDALNPELNADPFQANQDINQANRDQKDYLRERKIREKSGLPVPTPRNRVKTIESNNNNFTPTKYAYQIKVKNNGTKTIEKVVWEYIFFNSINNEEVGRLEFTSKTNIKPQETDTLSEEIISPPTGSIDVNEIGKTSSELYTEKINIKTIYYSDGSIWQSGLD